jgi:hypothetical protein
MGEETLRDQSVLRGGWRGREWICKEIERYSEQGVRRVAKVSGSPDVAK